MGNNEVSCDFSNLKKRQLWEVQQESIKLWRRWTRSSSLPFICKLNTTHASLTALVRLYRQPFEGSDYSPPALTWETVSRAVCHVWAPHYKRDVNKLEGIQQGGTKRVRGLSYKKLKFQPGVDWREYNCYLKSHSGWLDRKIRIFLWGTIQKTKRTQVERKEIV